MIHLSRVVVVVALLSACSDGGPTESATPSPASVTVTPASGTLSALGQTLSLTAVVRDAKGQTLTGVPLAWASSDGSIVTVDSVGLVTATGNGTAIVTATTRDGLANASVPITVTQQTSSIRLQGVVRLLEAFGDTLKMTAEAMDANGNIVAGTTLDWSSNDTSVAVVDSTGLVEAVGNGRARITVSTRNGEVAASTEIGVMQRVAIVRIAPSVDTLRALGTRLQMTAAALDANEHAVTDADFAWTSDNESVATVDVQGQVTTVEPGSVSITVRELRSGLTSSAALVVELRPKDILTALYHASGGPGWEFSHNRLTNAPLHHWHGVATDSRGRVTTIRLSENRLTGPLPRELSYLSSLVALDLATNNLTGPIPNWIGNLPSLSELNLANNALEGAIPPELGNLANLTYLNLSDNRLAGQIPPELGNLASLAALALNRNSLTGTIPSSLVKLRSLKVLALDSNRLAGQIPRWLGNLVELVALDLGSNLLRGPIPSEIGSLANLEHLSLQANVALGPIPSSLGQLSRLQNLWLAGSGLTSTIPPELGKLTLLQHLSLASNRLTGPIPSELGDLVQLVDLSLGNNQLTGGIPPELGRLTRLLFLRLGNNDLTGAIPSSLGDLRRLAQLDLPNLALTGPIPSEFGELRALKSLVVSNTSLSGRLPQQLTAVHLTQFRWAGTGLCAPANDAFQAWLRSITINVGEAACAQ